MLAPSPRIQWLADQIDLLATGLKNSETVNERVQMLRRMKVLIEELDDLIFSFLGNETTTEDRGQTTEI